MGNVLGGFLSVEPRVPANSFNIDFNDFDFWRATGGVTFRW